MILSDDVFFAAIVLLIQNYFCILSLKFYMQLLLPYSSQIAFYFCEKENQVCELTILFKSWFLFLSLLLNLPEEKRGIDETLFIMIIFSQFTVLWKSLFSFGNRYFSIFFARILAFKSSAKLEGKKLFIFLLKMLFGKFSNLYFDFFSRFS
jgi:hypothetical protein